MSDSTKVPQDQSPEETGAADPGQAALEVQQLDDLADVEFLLEGIEDKVAPLA
jgi:hypothetical protein